MTTASIFGLIPERRRFVFLSAYKKDNTKKPITNNKDTQTWTCDFQRVMMYWAQATVAMPLNRACAPCAEPIAKGNVKPGFQAWWEENCFIPEASDWSPRGGNNTTHVGVSYNSLRIQGYAYGAHGLPENLTNSPDDSIFPNVSLETAFGKTKKNKNTNAPHDWRSGFNLYC